MQNAAQLDELFHAAVTAMDAGNVSEVVRLISEYPELVRVRLQHPGDWLREKIGNAVDGFFQRPYLLWFVAEDPVRNGKLPANIAEIARAIITAAQSSNVESLQEQLDYALSLVSWSWIARECGVQIELIDVLVDAGAAPGRNPDNALINNNYAAAEHLVARGAPLTLSTALCLSRWDDVARLAPVTNAGAKQFALVLTALRGNAEGLRRILAYGVDINKPSDNLYSHGTPLHHAVYSGSLESVKTLVDAGAELNRKDTAWQATPVGWALYYVREHPHDEKAQRYIEIADYLRAHGGRDE